ncbi:MAG: GC-type dockerin domain-anchored protein [Phycisphaerales bacterium]
MNLIARVFLSAGLAGGLTVGAAMAQPTINFYTESFDSAVRNQPAADPSCPAIGVVWTDQFPAGWSVDDCGMPSFYCSPAGASCVRMPNRVTCSTCPPGAGITEWEGWTIASKDWWILVAGDQTRSQFTLGQGNVMIADPDEWDDSQDPVSNCGYFNAFVTTPSISLSGVDPATLNMQFASSWRPEAFDDGAAPQTNNQTARLIAVFNVGGTDVPVEILHYSSDESDPNYQPDSQNELVIRNFTAPVGATSVKFEFSLTNAGNDWWWAVDNIVFTGDLGGSPTTLFSEDFEGVTLRAAVEEGVSACSVALCTPNAYTHDGPNGSAVIVDSPASGGVPDWRGWSFVSREYWNCVEGNGTGFLLGDGLIAVADGDAYADLPRDPGDLDTTFITPSINISARTDNLLALTFDSSWRWEFPQTASITAHYNTGEVVEVLRWESDPSSLFFKADAVNEIVAVPLDVPPEASSVVLRFRYVGGNNWWWAIDDVRVFQGEAQIKIAGVNPTRVNMALAPNIDYGACVAPWAPDAPLGWTDLFNPTDANGVPYCGATPCGRPEWQGWSFPFREWWASPSVDLQRRPEFLRGTGRIAVADPDEWDDFPSGRAQFNAFLTSPTIPLPGSFGTIALEFDSSWRDECCDDLTFNDPPGVFTNNQTATVRAIYSTPGGDVTVDALTWQSDPLLPNFKNDEPNERVSLGASALNVPVGATAVRFEFGLTKARNDWWWAIDNIDFSVDGSSVYSENFEQAQNASAPPTEGPATSLCFYWSSVTAQPGGLTVDNTLNTGCAGGFTEFAGWTAWLTAAWADALGGTRGQFGAESAFVSDFQAGNCDGTTYLVTPTYSIGGLNANSARLMFRSGWLSESNHNSRVEVSYDGGSLWNTVLSWNPGNKSSTPDEIVDIPLGNPSGATSARIRFADENSGYWAIAEIMVSGVIGQPAISCPADVNGSGTVTVQDIFDFLGFYFSNNLRADVNNSGNLTVQDIFDFLQFYFTGC